MAYQFGVADVLAAIGVTAADFDIQSFDPQTGSDEAMVKTRLGAISAGTIKHTNFKQDATLVLKAKNPDGATATFNLGGVGTGVAEPKIIITGADAKQIFNDYGTLTVRCHSHPGTANAHLAAPALVAITTPLLGFGILDGVFLDNVGEGEAAAPADNLQSVDWTVESEHIDRQTRRNAFLVGATTGAKETASAEYVDDGTALTVSEGWVEAGGGNPENNADMKMKTVRATKQAA
jgi:hypothetical protein